MRAPHEQLPLRSHHRLRRRQGWLVAADSTPEHVVLLPRDTAARGQRLVFNNVPEPKTVKNRVHLDLITDTFSAEAKRLLDLGARQFSDHESGTSRWTTFADVEGNEFDLIAG